MLAAFDESRERLGSDYIDVYYLHVPDHATPIEETLEAVAELLQRGAIRAFGVSNYASWQMLEIDLHCDHLETDSAHIVDRIVTAINARGISESVRVKV